MRILFPFLALATRDKNVARSTAEKLLGSYEIKQLFPGHGKMIDLTDYKLNMEANI